MMGKTSDVARIKVDAAPAGSDTDAKRKMQKRAAAGRGSGGVSER